MAITQGMASSFKQELLQGTHVIGTDVLKIALFTSAATLSAATTAYAATNEASGTGYTAGGNTLGGTSVSLTGTTAFVSFADSTWVTASITARGALIYNSSKSNKAIAVLDFGADRTSLAGNFTVQFPANDATNAIVRIA